MKKGLVLLLAMVLVVGTLVACGGSDANDTYTVSPPNELEIALSADPTLITDGARVIGLRAVEILDEYLDGHISQREASDKISALREGYDGLSGVPENFAVSNLLTSIHFSFILGNEEVEQARNELANFVAN